MDGQPVLQVKLGTDEKFNRHVLVKRFDLHQGLGQHDICAVEITTDDFEKPQISSFFGEDLRVSVKTSEGISQIFSGLITGASQEHQLYGGWSLVLEGTSPSIKLDWTRCECYYYKKTIREISSQISSRNGGSPVSVKVDSKTLNYVQHGESDYEFLNRIADDAGACVVTTEDGIEIRKGFETVVPLVWHQDLFFCYVYGRIAPTSINGAFFDPAVGSGQRFSPEHERISGSGDYGKLYDSILSASRKSHPGQGDIEILNARVKLEDYSQMLKSESLRRIGRCLEMEAHSRNPEVRPGKLAAISNMPQDEGNGSYGIIRAVHHYTPEEGYSNRSTLTSWLEFTAMEKPRRNFHNGVVTAMVVDHNDPHKQGRVKVRFHWQEDETGWVRLAMPHGGGTRGMMFIPEVGDEVVVAFEEGDPERPFIIGSLWNATDQAPREPYRTASDIEQNEVKRIVTKSGNTVSLIDTPGKEVVEFSTPKGKCWIQLSNDPDAPDPQKTPGVEITTDSVPRITLHTEGDIVLDAPNGDVSIQCKNLNFKVTNDSTGTVGKNDTLKVAGNKEIVVEKTHKLEAGNISTSAMQSITVDANGTIEESSGAQVTVKAPLINLNP